MVELSLGCIMSCPVSDQTDRMACIPGSPGIGYRAYLGSTGRHRGNLNPVISTMFYQLP